jgi:hypothetical protein
MPVSSFMLPLMLKANSSHVGLYYKSKEKVYA